jgi:hypothetical protein
LSRDESIGGSRCASDAERQRAATGNDRVFRSGNQIRARRSHGSDDAAAAVDTKSGPNATVAA